MNVNRIAVRWNPLEPTEILERKFLDRAVPVAEQANIRTVFDVFRSTRSRSASAPRRGPRSSVRTCRSSRARTGGDRLHRRQRAERGVLLAAPVRTGRAGVSGRLPARVLTARDALKAVNPDIRVIAAGLSGKNDRTSTSPVRFLDALGDAYRKWSERAGDGRSRLPRLSAAQHPSSVAPLRGRTRAGPTSIASSRPSGTPSTAPGSRRSRKGLPGSTGKTSGS